MASHLGSMYKTAHGERFVLKTAPPIEEADR